MTISVGFLIARGHSHYIESDGNCALRTGSKGVVFVTLTCPNCGNDRNFQVKTLQMHVVHLEDGRVEVSEESRPAVLEVLCDECESALKFEEFEDTLRKEVLLTIGAR
jgi:RNase P subunit RPR2